MSTSGAESTRARVLASFAMTDRERELYENHQVLLALLGVLLHELRNPLHGATLLVEAMGMKSADVPTLRTKLKNQFAKLEAILSEVGQPVKELSMEPRVEAVEARSALLRAIERAEPHRSSEAEVRVEGDSSVRVLVDPILLERAMAELVLRAIDPLPAQGSPSLLLVRIEAASPSEVRVVFDDDGPALDETSQRSPFSLAAGGMRLAAARAVTMLAGGSLRLERTEAEQGVRFVMLLPRG